MNKYLFVFVCLMLCNISVVYAQAPSTIQAPVAGKYSVVKSDGKCTWGIWCFNQHGTGGHKAGEGVGGSDDTYAWDINLKTDEADLGKPVCAVEAGTIYVEAGEQFWGFTTEKTKSKGQILINHEIDGKKWSSGYLHMKDIVNIEGKVEKGQVIGYISNVGVTDVHLHFVVYSELGAPGVTLESVDANFTELSSCGDQVKEDAGTKDDTAVNNNDNSKNTTTSSTPATILLPKLAVGEGVEVVYSGGLSVRNAEKVTFDNQVGTITKADKTTGKVICGGIKGTVGGETYTFWYVQWDDGRRAWAAQDYLTFENNSKVKDSKVTANLAIAGYVKLREARLTPVSSSPTKLPVGSTGTATCGGVRGSLNGTEYTWWQIKWKDGEGWSAQGDGETDFLTRTTVSVKPPDDKPVFGNHPTKLVFTADYNICAEVTAMSVRSNTDISFNLSDISGCVQKLDNKPLKINGRMILSPVGVDVVDEDVQKTIRTFFPFRDVVPIIEMKGAKAITTLWNLGIVDGPEGTGGTFGYNDNVTRTEFLKMALLARAKGDTAEAKKVYEDLEGQSVASDDSIFSQFNDISSDVSWAHGYIRYAVKSDIMKGFNNKTFRPKDNVTREQATKILTLTYCDKPVKRVNSNGNIVISDEEDGCMVRKTESDNTDLFNRVKCKNGYKPFDDDDMDATNELCSFISQAKETKFIADWDKINVNDPNSTFNGKQDLKRWEMATSACRLYAKVANLDPKVCTQ